MARPGESAGPAAQAQVLQQFIFLFEQLQPERLEACVDRERWKACFNAV